MKYWVACLAVMTAAVVAPVLLRAQTTAPAAPVTPLRALAQRAAELAPFLNGGGDSSALFAPAFLAQVPDAQMRAISKQLSDSLGKALSVAAIEPMTANGARVRIAYERGTVLMNLSIEPEAPYRIQGLLITGTSVAESSIGAVVAALKAERGVTGFTLVTLGDGAPVLSSSLNPDRAGAIGSAFKLTMLAELIRATNAGERHWDDPVTLDGTPLPGGLYMQKPAGTRVTLRELAQKMISVSDNSAADILLATLGREKVEAMLPVIGWHDAARNRPLLSTLDMFKLKGIREGAMARQWPTLDEKGRRALLDGEVAHAPISAVDPDLFKHGKPVLIDAVEWYASPADLVRTMDWIRRNTESGPGAEARAILAINPGAYPANAAKWRYVGYKGGSEPGVINMNFLLQGKDGRWHALSAQWNDPTAALDEMRFVSLINRALELAAEQ